MTDEQMGLIAARAMRLAVTTPKVLTVEQVAETAKDVSALLQEVERLRGIIGRVLAATPHSMCHDAGAWVEAEEAARKEVGHA